MSGEFSCTVQRTVDATIDEVYDAWTVPEMLAEWLTYGGHLVHADVRVGGTFHIDMGGPPPEKAAHTGRYLVLDRPRCIEFTWVSAWTHGESLVRIELTALGDRTELVLVHSGLPDQAMADEHNEGWADFVRLAIEAVHRHRAAPLKPSRA
jgi:uncharacterized protein YndB with AHSA1/START domain